LAALDGSNDPRGVHDRLDRLRGLGGRDALDDDRRGGGQPWRRRRPAPSARTAACSAPPSPPARSPCLKVTARLVAPVALYPDVVLASLLQATTNRTRCTCSPHVGSQRVAQVPDDRGWDGSVVGLLVPTCCPLDRTGLDRPDGPGVTLPTGRRHQAIQDYRRAVQDASNLSQPVPDRRAAANRRLHRARAARRRHIAVVRSVAATQPAVASRD
jgi:hypothetical protein